MSRTTSKTLTDGELRIMKAVWRLKSTNVKQVVDLIRDEGELAYNTVQTMMGILTSKGYLERRKEGRAFVYEPLVSRGGARAEALGHVLIEFFGGSRQELVQNLLQSDDVDAAELDQLRELLGDSRQATTTKQGGE